MKKIQLFLSVLILFACGLYGQENRTELKKECLKYFVRNTLNNEDYADSECAAILKKDSDFIMRRTQDEYITFSTNDAGSIDKQMFHVKNKDTIFSSSYIAGKLIEKIEYNTNKEIEYKESLKNSHYYVEFRNYNEEWFLNNEFIFESKEIHLIRSLDKALLKIIFKDKQGVDRYVVDYKFSSSFHYDAKGKLIEKSINTIKDPKFKSIAPNGDSILVRLSHRAFDLKEYKK